MCLPPYDIFARSWNEKGGELLYWTSRKANYVSLEEVIGTKSTYKKVTSLCNVKVMIPVLKPKITELVFLCAQGISVIPRCSSKTHNSPLYSWYKSLRIRSLIHLMPLRPVLTYHHHPSLPHSSLFVIVFVDIKDRTKKKLFLNLIHNN